MHCVAKPVTIKPTHKFVRFSRKPCRRKMYVKKKVYNSLDSDVLLYGLSNTDVFVNSVINNFVLYQLPIVTMYRGLFSFSWNYTAYSLLFIECMKTIMELNHT